jgi:hypothetical protein
MTEQQAIDIAHKTFPRQLNEKGDDVFLSARYAFIAGLIMIKTVPGTSINENNF